MSQIFSSTLFLRSCDLFVVENGHDEGSLIDGVYQAYNLAEHLRLPLVSSSGFSVILGSFYPSISLSSLLVL